MSDHARTCNASQSECSCDCDFEERIRADERAADLAQRKALARLLLDSGDITPMGARLLKMPRRGGSDEG